MTTFVHVPNATRIGLHLAPKLFDAFERKTLRSKFGIQIGPRTIALDGETSIKPVEADLISGKDAGTRTATIGANQRAVLTLGSIFPKKYQALIIINPEFNILATVQHPQVVEPKESSLVRLVINAHKELKLADLEWYARVYLVE